MKTLCKNRSAADTVSLCADVCMFCLNMKNKKEALNRLESEK